MSLPPLPDLPALSTADLRASHGFASTAHWVLPGILIQGERPRDLDQIGRIVREADCRTFACLQAECVPEMGSVLLGDGGVQDWKRAAAMSFAYSDEVRALAWEKDAERAPAFLHYGIRDMSAAESMDGLATVVSDLADRIRSGERIYLHCHGGKGRAGLVAACLLIELYRDVDATSALEYVDAFCKLRNLEEMVNGRCTSPETEDKEHLSAREVALFLTKTNRSLELARRNGKRKERKRAQCPDGALR